MINTPIISPSCAYSHKSLYSLDMLIYKSLHNTRYQADTSWYDRQVGDMIDDMGDVPLISTVR